MTKQQYFEFAEKFYNDALEVSRKKNADYTGGDDDPFANFTFIEDLSGTISTEEGFLVRMGDKIRRLSSFVSQGTLQVKDESVLDTLQDLANYCCLMAGYIRSKGKVKESIYGIDEGFKLPEDLDVEVIPCTADNPNTPSNIEVGDVVEVISNNCHDIDFKGNHNIGYQFKVERIYPPTKFIKHTRVIEKGNINCCNYDLSCLKLVSKNNELPF